MFEKLTYEELMEYVPNDFDKFISDGLTPKQAISRLIVEYENQTDDYEDVSWIFIILLAELGMKNDCLKDNIHKIALDIISEKKLVDFWVNEEINDSEIVNRVSYLENVKELILKLESNS